MSCDVTDDGAVQALIDGAVGQFGRIDVMINNAGLGGTKSILEMSDAEWLRVLDITLNGTRSGARGPRCGRWWPRVTAAQ